MRRYPISIFVKPDELVLSKREHGGDNEVQRDALGRPVLEVYCWLCDGKGRRPSPNVEGNTVKCSGCKGEGIRTKRHKRVTSYIDVLEDSTNLMAWGERMVLVGVAADSAFVKDAFALHLDQEAGEEMLRLKGPALLREIAKAGGDEKEALEEQYAALKKAATGPRDELNRRAKAAKDRAGASRKADHGTHLHALSENEDEGKDLPTGIPMDDVIDMMAYRRGTRRFFKIEHMERLVVHDELGVAGTPDRVSHLDIEGIAQLLEEGAANSDLFKYVDGQLVLIAPDGSHITADELLITDLKTGRVDYGGLKMAMQLAIYSRAKLYVAGSPDRADLENVNQKWGIIMHLAAGSGELVLYWADLTLGWEAVEIATRVHEMRRRSKKALTVAPFGATATNN